jgi:hypothetical protein
MAERLAEAYLGRLPHRAQLRAQEGECRLRSTAQSSFGGSATDSFEELATGGEQRSFVGGRS